MPDRDPKRRPLSERDPTGDPSKCGHWGGRRKDGHPCVGSVIAGTDRCRMHGGLPVTQLRARGQILQDLAGWGLGDSTVDLDELYLRLISQSAERVQRYAGLLKEAYEAAAVLKDVHAAEQIILLEPETRTVLVGDEVVERPEHAARQVARQALERIFSVGEVAALVGYTYSATKDGDVYATGEAIRGLAKVEADERRFLADLVHKARMAGLAERQIQIAQRQGLEMASVFRRVLDALGLSDGQRALVPGLLAREIAAITGGGKIIEGSTGA